MGVTSTKRGRLAVIFAVAVVIISTIAIANWMMSSNADEEAQDFADVAYEQLKGIGYDDFDDLVAKDEVAAWTGEDDSPFVVEGRVPDVLSEVADGLIARYRILSSGTERCVDAIWPADGAFFVDVNACESYDRP